MKKGFMDPAKFMAKEPVISGGLCDIALATIEILSECDMSCMEMQNMLEEDNMNRQELLDRVIYELVQVSESGLMTAPLIDLESAI